MSEDNHYKKLYEEEKLKANRIEQALEKERLAHCLLQESLENKINERTKEISVARDQALEAVEAKSLFLANMSHEIRTPLNGVLGMLTLLQRTDINKEQTRFLKVANDSGNLLLSIINDILDFSKIEANKMSLEDLAFQPTILLMSSVEPFILTARDRGIQIHYRCDPDLPNAIYGDPTLIRQIITNLISNAIKFTHKGSVSTTISIIGEQYKIEVEDTGIGMDQVQLSRVFSAFSQGDNSITRAYGGTGLGLTICSRLIDMMGGKINVMSEVGKGTTFSVTLPLREAQIEEAPVELSRSSDSIFFSGEKVLLVEDNLTNQEIAACLLEQAGLTVDACDNGAESLEAVQQRQYDVILMDLQMPVMGGLEATKAIRALGSQFKDIPIIAMTANAFKEDKEACYEAGMNSHISKPIDVREVMTTIAEHLHKNKLNGKTTFPHEFTPPSSNNNEIPQEVIEILDGINFQNSVSRLGINWKQVATYLINFVEDNRTIEMKLMDCIDSADIEQLTITLHTLKGTSANLGAGKLSEIASELEQFAKENCINIIKRRLPNLLEEFNHVKSSVDQLQSSKFG